MLCDVSINDAIVNSSSHGPSWLERPKIKNVFQFKIYRHLEFGLEHHQCIWQIGPTNFLMTFD